MDISNCPDCGADTISVGLALWGDSDAPSAVFECIETECDWAGIAEEHGLVVRPESARAAA